MKAPRSYTREDVVEIHSHGGLIVVSKILELVIQNGARAAGPGEFTRRAFINGRIDLSQAEAVADIIQAKSRGAMEIASRQLTGGLRSVVEATRQAIIDIVANLEAEIEFPDEVDGMLDEERAERISRIERDVKEPIKKLLESYHCGRIFRDGVRLVIVGRPNVGKSSLMNRLVGKEKAIVTAVPGTTRDTVEEIIPIGNIEMHVADTAGLHESSDPVEVIGMQKTRERIEFADFILMVVEAHRPIQKGDMEILEQIDTEKTLLIRNKIDLCDTEQGMEMPTEMIGFDSLAVSAKRGIGIDRLKRHITDRCMESVEEKGEYSVITNHRHKDVLEHALAFTNSAREALQREGREDVVSMDLGQALDLLGTITGERVEEGVLDAIFSNFCIGK